MNNQLKQYKYAGARALVLLHEQHLRSFLDTWKLTKARNIALPKTDDTDYKSLETLLIHNLRAARGYMVWICDRLELSDPKIRTAPNIANVEVEAADFVEHLLERWRLPLVDIETSRFSEIYVTNWGMKLPIEAMLEHAVMHPIRHSFQLNNLLTELDKSD